MGHDPQAFDVDIDMLSASSFFLGYGYVIHNMLRQVNHYTCQCWLLDDVSPRKARFESGKWIEFLAACCAQYHSHWCTVKAGSFCSGFISWWVDWVIHLPTLVIWLSSSHDVIKVIKVSTWCHHPGSYMMSLKSWGVVNDHLFQLDMWRLATSLAWEEVVHLPWAAAARGKPFSLGDAAAQRNLCHLACCGGVSASEGEDGKDGKDGSMKGFLKRGWKSWCVNGVNCVKPKQQLSVFLSWKFL